MRRAEDRARFDVVRGASWVIVVGGGLAAVWAALELLPLLIPFLVAWGIALLLAPMADKVHAHTHLPRRLCSTVLLLLTLLLVALVMTLAVNRLFSELQRLLAWLAADGGERVADWIGRARDWFFGFGDSLPLLNRFWGSEEIEVLFSGAEDIVRGMITEMLNRISSAIPTGIAALLRALPGFLLFLAVMILSCFYFALDFAKINGAIRGILPVPLRKYLPLIRRRVVGTALRWLRAYLLLLTLTFFELLIGFSLLNLEYAFLPALLIAVVDLFPIFGVGTVLLPWGSFCLLGGNVQLGIGLFILYGVVLIVRQIAEPRIVGESIGLHPLLTLAAMYVGFRVWGLGGMLLSPAIAVAFGTVSGDREQVSENVRGSADL